MGFGVWGLGGFLLTSFRVNNPKRVCLEGGLGGIWGGGDLGWGDPHGGTPLPDPNVGLGAAADPQVGGGHFLGVSGAV